MARPTFAATSVVMGYSLAIPLIPSVPNNLPIVSLPISTAPVFFYRMVIVFATGKTMVLDADGDGRKKLDVIMKQYVMAMDCCLVGRPVLPSEYTVLQV